MHSTANIALNNPSTVVYPSAIHALTLLQAGISVCSFNISFYDVYFYSKLSTISCTNWKWILQGETFSIFRGHDLAVLYTGNLTQNSTAAQQMGRVYGTPIRFIHAREMIFVRFHVAWLSGYLTATNLLYVTKYSFKKFDRMSCTDEFIYRSIAFVI